MKSEKKLKKEIYFNDEKIKDIYIDIKLWWVIKNIWVFELTYWEMFSRPHLKEIKLEFNFENKNFVKFEMKRFWIWI